ncbi:hypothetical protein E2C01_012224 [Portunus trituberculatus]|uniref:Uncharacterized protein n=1 Tax=Portunus trituberculatus TaxID=210409 RepID=A0A5B7DCZ2_PORTR|nr:hypothetical protein [Portunus trituberculatus]
MSNSFPISSTKAGLDVQYRVFSSFSLALTRPELLSSLGAAQARHSFPAGPARPFLPCLTSLLTHGLWAQTLTVASPRGLNLGALHNLAIPSRGDVLRNGGLPQPTAGAPASPRPA